MGLMEKTIEYFSPSWALQRQANRNLKNLIGTPKASYKGAVATRMATPWSPSEGVIGFTHLNQWTLGQMRDRARELERNNGLVNGILNRLTDNVIGSGFQLQCTSQDVEWNKRAEDYLRYELDNIDITGNCWSEHQRLMFRSMKRDGDVGCILTHEGKVQPIEGDLITSPIGKLTDGLYQDGVECSTFGKPIRFWLKTSVNDFTPIEERDFIFLAAKKRFRVIRGEPCLSQSFGLIDQLDSYIESVITAARIAACYGLVVTKNNPSQHLSRMAKQTNADGTEDRIEEVEPGMIAYLNPGESIEQLAPNQPGTQFPDTVSTIMRTLGINVNLPLELVFLDWSKTSYSSARASLLQAYRSFKAEQQFFIKTYLSRLYRWKISKLINEGTLPAPRTKDQFNHKWIAEPWAFLDPQKEIQAIQMGIDTGIQTIASAQVAYGIDIGSWATQRSYELQLMRDKNIPIVHSTNTAEFYVPAPVTKPVPTASEPNPDEVE